MHINHNIQYAIILAATALILDLAAIARLLS